MAMRALRDGASHGVLKYFLLGILALAGGGLVFTDMGGFFRGGVGSTDIAKVGDTTISAQNFDRTLRASLQQTGLTAQQSYQMGQTHRVLGNEIRAILAQKTALDYGLNFGKKEIAQEINTFLAPLTQGGQDKAMILEQFLSSRGMSEAQLVQTMKRDMAINTVSQALRSGFTTVSDDLVNDMAMLDQETRTVEYKLFKDADFTDIEKPGDEDLETLYQKRKEAFAIPEMREGQIITIKTGGLKEELGISDEELRDFYDDNIENFSTSERRKIEQVALSSEEEANQVAEKVKAGAALKAALEDVIGASGDLIPARAYTEDELVEDAREAAFSAKKGEVVGPIETGLGYQILVIENITPEKVESFDTVKNAIKTELLETRVLDAKYELANAADDLLASGMSAEEIGEEIEVDITTLPKMNRFGLDAKNNNLLEGYKTHAQEIVENLFDLNEGEASPVIELEDGKLIAVLPKAVYPKSYKPFEEVKAELETQWVNDQKRLANREAVSALRASIEGGEKTFADAKGSASTLKLKRNDEAKEPLTDQAVKNIFEAPLNQPLILEFTNGTALVQVTKADFPKSLSEEELLKTKNDIVKTLQNEGFALFIEDKSKQHKAKINERLLEQLYGGEAQQ